MFALFIFKGASSHNNPKSSNGRSMRVVESLSLGVRKNLYIVEADGERFLIAGDVDRTSLISKLDGKKSEISENISANGIQRHKNYADTQGVHTRQNDEMKYESVIKNLAEKIRG